MRALVVYESMYGNTHEVAEAIGDGLREVIDTRVVSIHDVTADQMHDLDLLVVGGPTHAHGMSRPSTRDAAVAAAADDDSTVTMDADAAGDGVREWIGSIGQSTVDAAAFDTRVDIGPVLSGRAAKGIAKRLRQHGCRLVADPESFLVTKASTLPPHEHTRAHAWGELLGGQIMTDRQGAGTRPDIGRS